MIDKIKFYMNLGITHFEIGNFSFYIYSDYKKNYLIMPNSLPYDVKEYIKSIQNDYPFIHIDEICYLGNIT
jgi:hypothetical protein